MEAGDSKATWIPPEKGYGLHDQDLLFKAPGTAFHDPDQLKPGDVVSGRKEDQPFRAIMANVDSREITLDMNHPLAGNTLQFEVEILEID